MMILPRRGEAVDTKRRSELRKLLNAVEIERRIVQLKAVDEIRLFDVFSDDDIHQCCKELNIKFRERDFTPAKTLGLFVSQVLSRSDACSTMLNGYNRDRKRQGLFPVVEDASAYCKARARLPVELIDLLSERIVDIMRRKTQTVWKWMGRNVYLVDGFVLRAPDTAKNQIAYPQPSSQEEGLGFPQVRVVVTTSLATGCIMQYSTGKCEGKTHGETTLFREKHANFVEGDIVVTDCNFESFRESAFLIKRGVAIVACINSSRTSPFDGVCTTIDDTIITVKRPSFQNSRYTLSDWEALPESIQYRVIRYKVSGRKTEITIVTTLLDSSKYSAEAIAELYGLRWDVEVDIRTYKTTMGICDLRCLTPANLDREIATAVLAYNLVRLLMCDAAAVLQDIHPREFSFSHARDAWRNFSDELKTPYDIMWIILSASSRFVRNRPGRVEPREIKRRHHTKYGRLKAPRPSRSRRMAAAGDQHKIP